MYKCKNCGGTSVESLSWVDLNTGEIDADTDDVGEYYCRDCSAHTDVDYQQSPFIDDILDGTDVSVHSLDKPNIKEL